MSTRSPGLSWMLVCSVALHGGGFAVWNALRPVASQSERVERVEVVLRRSVEEEALEGSSPRESRFSGPARREESGKSGVAARVASRPDERLRQSARLESAPGRDRAPDLSAQARGARSGKTGGSRAQNGTVQSRASISPAKSERDEMLLRYRDLVASLLAREKQYPRLARLRSLEGKALLSLTLGERGEVLAARLVRSSTVGVLDREVLGMVERAAPFPAIPREVNRRKLRLLVPVSFTLGDS